MKTITVKISDEWLEVYGKIKPFQKIACKREIGDAVIIAIECNESEVTID